MCIRDSLYGFVLDKKISQNKIKPSEIFPAISLIISGGHTILGTFFVLSTKIKPEYKKALGASYWLIVLMFATYLISFIGAFGPLSSPLIPFPYDNIVEIVIGLIIFYWAIRVSYRTEELEKVLKQQYI